MPGDTEREFLAQPEVGLAEAMFDNDAEWPDELAFRRGELLRVLDQRPSDGLADGWWLCGNQRGDKGIAPANRLRMMHRFHFPENRVITPRRFGDLFLYNQSLFGSSLDDDFFNPRRFVGVNSPDYSLRLVHDADHPLPVSSNGFSRTLPTTNERPIIRDVPIKVERSPTTNKSYILQRTEPAAIGQSLVPPRPSPTLTNRRSPPPPPQRKYFNLVPPGGSGSSSSEDERKKLSPQNQKSGLLTDRVQWRSALMQKQNGQVVPPSPSLPTDDPRTSNTSTISLSPGENSSERSSSLSEGSNRSSVLETSTYDVPSNLHKPVLAHSQTDKPKITRPKPSLPPRPPKIEERPSTSVLQNVLEGLYDTPTTQRSERSGSLSEKRPTPTVHFADTMKRSTSLVNRANSEPRSIPVYDVPKPVSKMSVFGRKLKEEEEKIVQAAKLLQTTTAERDWRAPNILQGSLPDIQEAVQQMCDCMKAFIKLSGGAVDSGDGSVMTELTRLVQPLRQSAAILDDLKCRLRKTGWTLACLSRRSPELGGLDDLDRFLAVSRQVPQDCKQVTALVESNPSLSYDSAKSPMPTIVVDSRIVEEHEVSSDLDDYDFVDEKVNNVAEIVKEEKLTNGVKSPSISLCPEDKQIMTFYLPQVDTHMECLNGAIEDFFTSIEEHQAPREFVGRSKLVILAAHKLVYIGDSVAQCLRNQEAGEQMRKISDRLCEMLKECVTATKSAAEKYPAIQQIQVMVDSMVGVSHSAHELKLIIRQYAAAF